MFVKISEKIHGGKLVKIELTYEKKITEVKITGDFFLHPEESIDDVEDSIVGTPISFQEHDIEQRIEKALKKREAEFVGLDAGDIEDLIRKAIDI